jgi:hypothetical protein
LRSGIIKVALKTLKNEKEFAKTASNLPLDGKAWANKNNDAIKISNKKDQPNNPQPNR